jgi:hypothetical protein
MLYPNVTLTQHLGSATCQCTLCNIIHIFMNLVFYFPSQTNCFGQTMYIHTCFRIWCFRTFYLRAWNVRTTNCPAWNYLQKTYRKLVKLLISGHPVFELGVLVHTYVHPAFELGVSWHTVFELRVFGLSVLELCVFTCIHRYITYILFRTWCFRTGHSVFDPCDFGHSFFKLGVFGHPVFELGDFGRRAQVGR